MNFGDLAPATKDPKAMVRTVVQSSGWQLAESGEAWQVTIPIGSLRKQTVNINFARKDADGHGVISFTSLCGPASEKNAMALLRYNTKILHGAFAVQSTPSGEVIVVQANQLAETVDPLEITRVMTAVAWQADKAEEQLGGTDQY